MLLIKKQNGDLYKDVKNKKFVVQKLARKFSLIAMNHNHERKNVIGKGVGGAREDDEALRRWCVCGPEVARVLKEFEACRTPIKELTVVKEHHKANTLAQKTFMIDVKNLTTAFEESGNPFTEDSKDSYSLESKEVKNDKLVFMVLNIEKIGQEEFKDYYENRIIVSKEPLTNTIKKNKFTLFRTNTRMTD